MDNEDQLDSYKCRQARRFKIPIVSTRFLVECAEQQVLVDIQSHLLEKTVNAQQFAKGKIAGTVEIVGFIR